MESIAKGQFKVALKPLQSDDLPESTGLARMSIDKTIDGDLVATTVGQMLSAGAPNTGSAGYVAIERVTGSLHGKKGSFALQHFGVMDSGKFTLNILVVPGSGTGELADLRGSFVIEIAAGVHSYVFNYSLPD